MTANRRLTTAIIASVGGLLILGQIGVFGRYSLRAFGVELYIAIAALLPVVLLVGIVWYGIEVLATLRRIEAATVHEADVEPEFTHGA